MNCAVFFAIENSSLVVARVGYGAYQGALGLARVEPGVLHHYGWIRPDDASVVGVGRDGLRVLQLVEPHVQRVPGRDLRRYGPGGSLSEKNALISTCASSSEVLSGQAVSWLVTCGSGPLLRPGTYPSAVAQRLRPMGSFIALTSRSVLRRGSPQRPSLRFVNTPSAESG
jgi:hypothetical protein